MSQVQYIVPAEVKQACDDMLTARSLTSFPLKFEFATTKGFTSVGEARLDEVHEWMKNAHRRFEQVVAGMVLVEKRNIIIAHTGFNMDVFHVDVQLGTITYELLGLDSSYVFRDMSKTITMMSKSRIEIMDAVLADDFDRPESITYHEVQHETA